MSSQVVLVVKNLPAKAGDTGSIPESGRYHEVENGNSLQYSCLENYMNRGAWESIYCPWDSRESKRTEQLSTQTSWHILSFKPYCVYVQGEISRQI